MAFLPLLVFSACTPKITSGPVRPAPVPETTSKVEIPPAKQFSTAHISVLIPFKLHQIDLKTATKAQIERTDMAIDFYQGLKLGIDSAAMGGLNFELRVFDSKDDQQQLGVLQQQGKFDQSNLMIGPVFPEGVKYMSSYSMAKDLPLVSPLAASRPSEFANPKLISIVNHIDQHSEKIAAYIGKHFETTTSVVVLINPKRTEDEEFAAPLRAYLKAHHPSLLVQEFASANAFETRMMKGKQYAVVVCSSTPSVVRPAIDKLLKLTQLKTGGYPIQLFGHPAWIRQSYQEQYLQSLKTIISTSYYVDYKSSRVTQFIKNYRSAFQFEPSEYAFKGFDVGFYFGRLMQLHGEHFLDFLTKENYKGLQNSFSFQYNPEVGYYNTELKLLQYRQLAWLPIN